MSTLDKLKEVFEYYKEDYEGYDKNDFVDFVVSNIVEPKGFGVQSLISYYENKAVLLKGRFEIDYKVTLELKKSKKKK